MDIPLSVLLLMDILKVLLRVASYEERSVGVRRNPMVDQLHLTTTQLFRPLVCHLQEGIMSTMLHLIASLADSEPVTTTNFHFCCEWVNWDHKPVQMMLSWKEQVYLSQHQSSLKAIISLAHRNKSMCSDCMRTQSLAGHLVSHHGTLFLSCPTSQQLRYVELIHMKEEDSWMMSS